MRLVHLLVMAFFGLYSFAAADDSPATWPDEALSAKARYEQQLAEAAAAFDKSHEAIRKELESKAVAAKAEYDALVKKSRDAYVAELEKLREQESGAKREETAADLRRAIDELVKGPELNEIQKAWLASYEAEYRQQFDDAIGAARKAIELTGSNSGVFANIRLGWLHYLDADYDSAEQAYRKAAANSPNALTPLYGLLNCDLARSRLDEAEAVAGRIVKISPLDSQANKSLGDLLYGKKQFREAAAYYKKLATAYPDNFDMATSLAWCHLNLGETETAAKIFRDVLAVQPYNASANHGLLAIARPVADNGSITTGKIVVRNLESNGEPVIYMLDEQRSVQLEPGRAQTLEPNEAREIRFARGAASGEARYRLSPGTYEFRRDDGRWELRRLASVEDANR